MANKSKAKGTKGETKVVRYLQEHGIEAQRRALAGSKDVGDVEYQSSEGKRILEVKTGKMTSNYNRTQKEQWLGQTREEAKNSGMEAHLVINRYNRSINDSEVWSADGTTFWYLDDFVKEIGGTFE